jgi:hypothetical protein
MTPTTPTDEALKIVRSAMPPGNAGNYALGVWACVYYGYVKDAIDAALTAPKPPKIDGLDDAIRETMWLYEGETDDHCRTIYEAARAYQKLQGDE